jgi:predicted secreted protein
MAKTKSFGTRVFMNGIAVGGLTDISASGTEVNFVDTTSHDNAGGWMTFLAGLKDGGTLELTGRYNYADAGQAEWKAEEGVKHNVYILLPDNSGMAFEAIIGGFATSNPLDDAVEFSATAKITGPVYPIFPTLTITGTLTSDGSTPVVFPALTITGFGDRPIWSDGGVHLVSWDLESSGVWGLRDGSALWLADQDVLLPTLVTSWTAQGTATGTPTVTGS